MRFIGYRPVTGSPSIPPAQDLVVAAAEALMGPKLWYGFLPCGPDGKKVKCCCSNIQGLLAVLYDLASIKRQQQLQEQGPGATGGRLVQYGLLNFASVEVAQEVRQLVRVISVWGRLWVSFRA